MGCFNFTAAGYILFLCWQSYSETNRFKTFESNEAFNRYIIKEHSGFLATCINLVIQDIQNQGNKPNDFRIRQIGFEEAITQIPEDTTDMFYNFHIVYTKNVADFVITTKNFYKINPKGKLMRDSSFDSPNKIPGVQTDSIMKSSGRYTTLTYH